MKRLSIYLIAVLISLAALLSSFTNNDLDRSSTYPPNEFETLLNYLEANNNFINSPASPALVMADEVKKNMKDPKYHIIDIRTDSWFEYSHIKDANNVQPEDLLSYFETKITPADFDKIVVICYSGQSAAYFTSLLRLAGYDNVYSMKWGMSSWRLDFAEDTWLKNISDDFADKLETNENAKPEKGAYPSLNTSKTDAQDILRTRLEKAFATPYKEFIIQSEDIFTNPSDYFVLDYRNQEKYANGHIPGAVLYEPNGSLASTTDLATLPNDKKVAVFSATGQEAAYVVAYLNLLGYEVGNVAYGANAIMNKTLKEKDWDAFTKKEINMFPVIE
ncbi:MAG: rhodanese-like domain-containing protein [Maribacter sp.]|uniref:rhodanese-like domain-containing protein n=1 Tax=Maribacter sp. TaxID=1897614 RepID=UPI003C734012